MIKLFYIEAQTAEEAVQVAKKLTDSGESPQYAALPANPIAQAADDPLLTLEEIIASDLVPMRRLPKSARTVRDWIRAGKIPEPVEGFGLAAKWRRSQLKKIAS